MLNDFPYTLVLATTTTSSPSLAAVPPGHPRIARPGAAFPELLQETSELQPMQSHSDTIVLYQHRMQSHLVSLRLLPKKMVYSNNMSRGMNPCEES